MDNDILEKILNNNISNISVQSLMKCSLINSKWHNIIKNNTQVIAADRYFRYIEQIFYYNLGVYDHTTYKRELIKKYMPDKKKFSLYYSSITTVYVHDDLNIGIQRALKYEYLPILWNFLLYFMYTYINLDISLVNPDDQKKLLRKYRTYLYTYIYDNRDDDIINIIPMVYKNNKYLCCIVSPNNMDLYDREYIIIESDNIYETVYEKSLQCDLNGAGALLHTFNEFVN